MGLVLVLVILGVVGLACLIPVANAQRPSKLDIILVLDNSGSMKANDPQFMMRTVVPHFFEGLAADAQVGLVIFAEKTDLTLPLASASAAETKEKVAAVLNQIDYNGQYTNSPQAIERAIYELKQNGRKDAEKLIVFMTDGIVDTGDKTKDQENLRWLKEELAADSKASGIRIFGIAFTEQADFTLIQILGQKTNGGYYRVFKTEDIQGVFDNIQQTITNLKPAATGANQLTGLWIIAIIGIIVLGVIAMVVIFSISKGKKVQYIGTSVDNTPIPAAHLEDVSGVTGRTVFKITKKVTTVGRIDQNNKGDNPDIGIPQKTVSAIHATIEYRDQKFYLIDQQSTNGTSVNQNKIKEATPLKSGDVIAFDRYKFKFVLPAQKERGGTVLSPPLKSSGTVLSSPKAQDIPDAGGSKPEANKPEPSAPKPIEAKPPVAVAAEADSKETRLKEMMCPVHSSLKATELCPVCKQAFCNKCMVEKNGKMICRKCFDSGKD
jgi:pSer/pThr/pTyr-binding forkhead associated (FHA) protein/Mg-chelatase subunit ChlD